MSSAPRFLVQVTRFDGAPGRRIPGPGRAAAERAAARVNGAAVPIGTAKVVVALAGRRSDFILPAVLLN